MLERTGFERRAAEVVVPTWRARDVTREIDVVEEIARFRLDEVPFTLPQRREMFGRLTPLQRLRRRVEEALAGLGLVETYTSSLREGDADPRALRLPEPISLELAVLRTRLLPSLVKAAERNLELGAHGIALFEIARVYLPADGLPDERRHVAGIVEGGWSRAKGVVEALYAALKAEPRFEQTTDELLHPRKAATVGAGILGELHPQLLEGSWGVFELDLEELLAAAPRAGQVPGRRQLPARARGPRVRRPRGGCGRRARGRGETRPRAPSCARCGRSTSTAASRSARAASRSRSRVTFQSAERTLTDEDAAGLRERIVDGARRALRRGAPGLRGVACDADVRTRGLCRASV